MRNISDAKAKFAKKRLTQSVIFDILKEERVEKMTDTLVWKS